MKVGFLLLALALLPAVCVAQTTDPSTNQKVLDELKGLRTSIDRLAKLMEVMEAGQKTDLTLRRIQLYEDRIATLETQRERLSTQEQQVIKDVAAATNTLRTQDAALAQGLLKSEGPVEADPQRVALRNRINDGSRSLDETRRKREAVEREITSLKGKITTLEKTLDEAAR